MRFYTRDHSRCRDAARALSIGKRCHVEHFARLSEVILELSRRYAEECLVCAPCLNRDKMCKIVFKLAHKTFRCVNCLKKFFIRRKQSKFSKNQFSRERSCAWRKFQCAGFTFARNCSLYTRKYCDFDRALHRRVWATGLLAQSTDKISGTASGDTKSVD